MGPYPESSARTFAVCFRTVFWGHESNFQLTCEITVFQEHGSFYFITVNACVDEFFMCLAAVGDIITYLMQIIIRCNKLGNVRIA